MPDRSKGSLRPLGSKRTLAPSLGGSKALVRRQKNREIRANELLEAGIHQRTQAFDSRIGQRRVSDVIDSKFEQTN
jgi:hypothetical protein